jgi:uncharacterized protein with ParB-like and HNH nuclease domain
MREFEPKNIAELEGLTFKVADYQRGYKWGVQQVIDLLTDIHEFEPEGNHKYCLQPIVVQSLNEPNQYELIDGQQRMTTIYILFSIAKKLNYYKIKYNTRDSSRKFLEEIYQLPPFTYEADIPDTIEAFEKENDKAWGQYISENLDYDNVDNYHFFRTFQVAWNWFKKEDISANDFFSKVRDSSFVIWYKVDQNETPERIFRNLNSGKIPLTSSELIKALFILELQEETNFVLREFKQNELAQEWNEIENTLSNKRFWYFIRGFQKSLDYPIRIDLLFDIDCEKKLSLEDDLFAYRVYNNRVKQKEKLDWNRIKTLFQKLIDWYNDDETYHLIGFMTSVGISSISDILKESKNKGKTAFRQYLKDLILAEFKIVMKREDGEYYLYALDELDYKNNSSSRRKKNPIEVVLILFNVATYQRTGFRFPFDLYHHEDWSIEHIHPQNAKALADVKEALDWIDDFKKRLEKDGEKERDDINELYDELKQLDGDQKLTKVLRKKLEEVEEAYSNFFDLDKISNLTLLDRNTNSKIGNKKFLKKRQEILNSGEDAEESYIPICTSNTFMKYYTKDTEDIQMSCWSSIDGEDYKNAIAETLLKYLPQSENGK